MSAENRRARLKLWFSSRPIPEREKSYLSQLINGKASFGEKAARRLERDYGMGDKYLDSDHVNMSDTTQKNIAAITSLLKKLNPRELGVLMGKIEGWTEGKLEPDKIPEQQERSNFDRRNGTQ